ncbi:hypothetical protein Y1Q_0014211 [Alligator mississippiensis]|uniref:PRA1 family protein n=1 Tax=Alligator mississippiensis TaxID=8496 RepID=A0A151MU61_ALLMI|nr:hypothetical protein Y1Q_0014211 [Alligator mississippiensis]
MEVQESPLWPWDNFFPRHDSFMQLGLGDMPKWSHHVVSNLLYYQTNYVVLAAAVVSFMGFLHPLNVLLGSAMVVLVFVGFVWVSYNKDILGRFKRQYRTVFMAAIMLSRYFLISCVGAVMVFIFGITLPLLLTFIHASLRWDPSSLEPLETSTPQHPSVHQRILVAV